VLLKMLLKFHEHYPGFSFRNQTSPFVETNSTQVIMPQIKTGWVTGAMTIMNSINPHRMVSAMRRLCGSPTLVHNLPKAVPTTPCIIKLRKDARNLDKTSLCVYANSGGTSPLENTL
jgi:hypothetical protein